MILKAAVRHLGSLDDGALLDAISEAQVGLGKVSVKQATQKDQVGDAVIGALQEAGGTLPLRDIVRHRQVRKHSTFARKCALDDMLADGTLVCERSPTTGNGRPRTTYSLGVK